MANKCIASYNGSENNGKEMVTIINFLIKNSLSTKQAAAIIGCIQKASDFRGDIDIIEDGKLYIGICLWDETRGENLKKMATQNNKDWKNLDFQLDFMWSELNGDYKNVLDWFKANENASIKECIKKWEENYEKCGDKKRCDTRQKEINADLALKFYEKYANNDCTPIVSSEVNSGSNEDINITVTPTDTSGLNTDESKPQIFCGVQVNATIVGGSTDSNTNTGTGSTDTPEANTTDYNGKTLALKLEREEFSQERTFGRLYDTTDGKKQFICYTVEDGVRYKGNKCNKTKSKTAIPYGSYKLCTAANAYAHKKTSGCNDSVGGSCHFYYAGEYSKFPEYNTHMPRVYTKSCGSADVNNDGCSFNGILLHASPDTNRGSESNSAGCIILGLEKQTVYLSKTQEAFLRLMEEYVFPAKKAGSNMTIDIPRLYSDKDQFG